MPNPADDFLLELESADPESFTKILQRNDRETERDLERYFGPDLAEYRRLAVPSRASVRGNVVVLHGIMGSHLVKTNGTDERTIWLNPWSLLTGRFADLALSEQGIRATGLLKRYYGKQLLRLGQRWNVRAFAYDWRLSLDESAKALGQAIDGWFPGGATVHLVGHSMGGLVARAFLALRRSHQGRLIMLGTPNRGSYSVPQLLHGYHSTLNTLALLDLRHSKGDIVRVLRGWPGVHAMDPANAALSTLPVDPARMIYIAGSGRKTAVAIADETKLDRTEGYVYSGEGDGTVPHNLGLLEGVPTYYVDEEHGALPDNRDVLAALDELLEDGSSTRLARSPITKRGASEASGNLAGFLAASTSKSSEIEIRSGAIESVRDVDAVLVGYYQGVPPALFRSHPALTALAKDTLRGGLGEPFYLPALNGVPPLLLIGMGEMGRFGERELGLLSRRAIETAHRLGLRRVAATIIGAGTGNLPFERAAHIWRRALENSAIHLAFFELDPARARRLAELVGAAEPAGEPTHVPAVHHGVRSVAHAASRLSIEKTSRGYRLAVLTNSASIPEREIEIDHRLIDELNAKLRHPSPDRSEWAECLRRLLFPHDVREAIGDAGLVLACDRATAQIQWEAIAAGVSRQFRSLRSPVAGAGFGQGTALVVADTCADAPLPSARAEGEAVAGILARHGVKVRALLGPAEASRSAVLRELMLRPYDVFHFAGHCQFDAVDPAASGWVFSGNTILSARELARFDRIPALIFSNACESGAMPSKTQDAPGFAEALFSLGVSNLICTAWPVGDQAAGAFGRTFYEHLGQPLSSSLKHARLAVGDEAIAWQHYGDPETILG
jgi:pimeloyl-ACP methyl ester carboxylesterase